MTNTSAMTALQSLKATNKQLDVTQARISTGLRVSQASDNAAYWSISTTMKSDNGALSAVQDALGLGAGKLDTAYTVMDNSLDLLDSIKQGLINARGASEENQAKIQEEINVTLDQLRASAQGASYGGTNMLATNDTSLEVVSSYNRASDGTTSVGTISVDLSDVTLFGINTGDGSLDETTGLAKDIVLINVAPSGGPPAVQVTDAAIDGFLSDVEAAISSFTTAAANLGAAKNRIDLQQDFVSNLMDSIDRGVGQLVDADMNEESTRLKALQTQQQLGIQSLSIANQNAQGILALFQQ